MVSVTPFCSLTLAERLKASVLNRAREARVRAASPGEREDDGGSSECGPRAIAVRPPRVDDERDFPPVARRPRCFAPSRAPRNARAQRVDAQRTRSAIKMRHRQAPGVPLEHIDGRTRRLRVVAHSPRRSGARRTRARRSRRRRMPRERSAALAGAQVHSCLGRPLNRPIGCAGPHREGSRALGRADAMRPCDGPGDPSQAARFARRCSGPLAPAALVRSDPVLRGNPIAPPR
jgi:hypothetical protein